MNDRQNSAAPRQSLIEYLAEFRRHSEEPFYIEQQGYRRAVWSYGDVAATAAQFARELERRGVAPGERVLLRGRNCAEWVAAFLGCVLRGAVVVPLDAIATADFVSRVADEVSAKLIVSSLDHEPANLAMPRLNLKSLRESIAHNSGGPYASPELDRNSIAEIIFTSGATAEPKGVVISHENVLANLEPLEVAMQPYLKWERFVHPLRFLDAVPLSHVFGQFLGVWIPPLLGASVVFHDSLNPSELMRTIHDERVSVLVAVPRVLQALRNKIERDLEAAGHLGDFRSAFAAAENEQFLRRMWRFRWIHRQFGWKFWAVISGGATLDADTERFWTRTGFAAIQGYGLTETTSLISVNHPFRLSHGSIGKILEGREVKLDAGGEILVRGKNIATGYWQGGAIRSLPGQNGDGGQWFHTGDLGALDDEGNLYFKGRKKEVIVTPAGMNIYPEDLEAALHREPEVRDCVVVPLERDGNAEPCAVLLLRDDAGHVPANSAAASHVVARANAQLAEYQRMRGWYVWPAADFPRTSVGKPKLAEIRAAAFAARSPANARNATPEAAGQNLSGSVAEVIARLHGAPATAPASVGTPNAGLETDLNLTSLDRVELLGALEDRYHIQLNETRFTSAKTVDDIEQLVRESAADSNVGRTDFVFPLWPQSWPFRLLRNGIYYLLTWPATHLLAHPRVFGRNHLRGVKGPLLVISNHVIYLDVGFVLAALPPRQRHRLAVAMGGERLAEMRRPPRDWPLLRRVQARLNYFLVTALFNVFPLPKRAGFRESFHFAGNLTDRGWSLLVFPEGELTADGKLQPFRGGIGLLAQNLKIPVLPMRIDGAYEIREAGSIFNRPGRVRVIIGSPVRFPANASPEEITHTLEKCVAEL